jgi:tetratricopeptide (TPR) repeat protein
MSSAVDGLIIANFTINCDEYSRFSSLHFRLILGILFSNMQPNLDDLAIRAALDGNWQVATTLNEQILASNPHHIPALNRLAKAYSQQGKNDEAIATYERVLCLDKFNGIAKKNCGLLKKSPCIMDCSTKTIFTDFIEEPGKTKTTPLVRLGDAKTLLNLQPGQLVNLVVKNHWIVVTTQDNNHIGALADNVSFRLKQLMQGGNTFQAVIRTVSANQVTVFLREIHRAKEFANSPSF